jgi:ABC-type multidrug transport system ATPase subunit
LLKILAGRVPHRLFDGDVWLAGRRLADVNAHRLIAYVGAEDTHLPLLTVK